MLRDVLSAFSLLTIVPVPLRWLEAGRPPSRAMAAYPLVGAVMGLTLMLAQVLLGVSLPRWVAAALVLVAWIVLTGGLHLDGWADCCDALPASVTRERRLEILKDPRLGSFGVAGLGLLLLVKFAALASLPPASAALVLAPTLGRWAIVNVAAIFPLARPDGMAVTVRAGLSRRELTWAALTTALVCGAAGWSGLITCVVAAVVIFAFGRWAAARLGGVTGDVYGATCELVECVVVTLACFRF